MRYIIFITIPIVKAKMPLKYLITRIPTLGSLLPAGVHNRMITS